MTTETAFTGIHAILYALFDEQDRVVKPPTIAPKMAPTISFAGCA